MLKPGPGSVERRWWGSLAYVVLRRVVVSYALEARLVLC